MQASELRVRAGEWDSRTTDEIYKHQDRDVEQLIIHPEYKDRALHNDLALLVLREDVRVGYHIGTVCLPDQNQKFDRQDCLVSGWGKDKFGMRRRPHFSTTYRVSAFAFILSVSFYSCR